MRENQIEPMTGQWGTTDIARLESAVMTSEQLVPMLVDTVKSVGRDIANLSTRIGGNVDNVRQTVVSKLMFDAGTLDPS